jgi:hypothetical protein
MELKVFHKDKDNNIIRDSGYILDPFSEEEIWIYVNRTWYYFMDNYGLEPSQVWNLVHGFDKDEKHYCLYCECELPYRRLDQGFGSYCCTSCQVSAQWEIKELREKRRLRARRDMIKRLQNPEYKEYQMSRVHSVESIASRNFTRFMNETPDDIECCLYLAIAKSGNFKFGITKDLNYRRHTGGYVSIKPLYKGDKETIAWMEYDLVIALGSEWISDLKEFNKQFILEVQRLSKWHSEKNETE